MYSEKMRNLELLAPARDAATAIAAIDHGADAVYMGAPAHGARAAATNSIDDIRTVCRYAHLFGARVYITVNTIVRDSELDDVCAMVREICRAGADALIVQDMALLRMPLPPIALHASTQCDTRDPAKARFLADAGFSQIVLARELTLDEISAIGKAVDVPLEAFVHGALCVSYSGDCQMSFADNGRSANRGECAQMCRLSYDLVDGTGATAMKRRHLLSLRDMNRISMLGDMAEAGVSSFKIEGRLKDIDYVKNVTAAYSRALDEFIAANPGRFRRASQGRSILSFTPDLTKSFNRGFTDYFLSGPRPAAPLGCIYTPKDPGTVIGRVEGRRGAAFKLRLLPGVTLGNGDGLCYFTPDGEFRGFRINRAEGDRIFPASKIDLPAGTELRRNSDAAREALMRGKTARRVIDCDAALWLAADRRLCLRLTDDYGVDATAATDQPLDIQTARTPDTGARRTAVARLGDTRYMLRDFTDSIPADVFIPASVLATLRRKAVEAFDIARETTRVIDRRRPEATESPVPGGTALTYHNNVANRLSRSFYTDHGASRIDPALEVMPALPPGELRVMTCRHCIRRQLGACLREGGEKKLRGPLFLTRGNHRWRLDFDCAACRMHVVRLPLSRDPRMQKI